MTSNKLTKIIKIEFTPEQQDLIDKINKGEPIKKIKIVTNQKGRQYEYTTNKILTQDVAKKRLRELYGGICCICGNCPDYKVVYDAEGAKRVERYCQKDFDVFKERIK